MNFNYGYNVKAMQPLQAKQVEKVKEEVVEKKEAEVKAEGPKYEVITGAANILADINKATVKGAGETGSTRGRFDNLLKGYQAKVADFEANAANLSPKEKIEKLDTIICYLGNICSCEEFEAQSNDFKTGIARDIIHWRDEGLNAARDLTTQLNDGLQIPKNELSTLVTRVGRMIHVTSLDSSANINSTNANGVADIVSNYTDTNMFEYLSDNVYAYTDFLNTAYSHGASGPGITNGVQNVYAALSNEIENVKAGMEGKTSAEKVDTLNSISTKLTNLIKHPGFDADRVLTQTTKDAILADYCAVNAERDSIIGAEAEAIMNKKGNVTFEEMKSFVDLLQMVPDSVDEYELIASKLSPEQSLAFFESKYEANQSVLAALEKCIGNQQHKLPKGIMEAKARFDELQDAVKFKIEAAQAAANAQ